MEVLSNLANFIVYGFVLTVPILLLGLVLKNTGPGAGRMLIISNYLLLLATVIFLVVEVQYLWEFCSPDEEDYSFPVYGFFYFFGPLLFRGLIPQLFWLKKLRNNKWTGICLLPFLLVDSYAIYFYPMGEFLSPSWSWYINWEIFIIVPGFYFFLLYSILTYLNRKGMWEKEPPLL